MSPGDIQSYLSHEWKCWRWATALSGCPPPTCVSIIICMWGWLSTLRRKRAMPLSFTIWVIYSVSFIEREFINADMQDVIIQMMLWKEAVRNQQSEFCWYPGQCFCGWSCLKKIMPRNAFSPSLKQQPLPTSISGSCSHQARMVLEDSHLASVTTERKSVGTADHLYQN